MAMLAQVAPPELGARIRVTVGCESASRPAPESRSVCRFVGTLAGWRTDSIDLDVDGARSTYDLNALRQVEVSRGLRSHKLLGAGLGFVVGAAGTFQLLNYGGSTGKCNQSENQDAIDAPYCLGIYGLGGLAGAGLGALIGSRIKTESWQSLPGGRFSVGLVGQGLKVTVAF